MSWSTYYCFRAVAKRTVRASLRSRSYSDQTLEWARSNPAVAQHCLKPPSYSVRDSSVSQRNSNSLEDYCRWRRWPHSSQTSELHSRALALSSHVLSAPLTLAKFRGTQGDPDQRWCCVGARAEATIPTEFWNEYLLLSSSISGSPLNTVIDFVGPDVHTKTPSQHLELDGSKVSLNWTYQGFYHDLEKAKDDDWDAFVFLNPGFGHPHLQEGWSGTISRLIPHGKPMLLTAHSARDAERDTNHLKEFGVDVTYTENPFASRITYEDPFQKGHIVQPNQFVAHLYV